LSRAIAARLMKGVVRPQQAPTIRKEITQRQVDGLGVVSGTSESMVCEADMISCQSRVNAFKSMCTYTRRYCMCGVVYDSPALVLAWTHT